MNDRPRGKLAASSLEEANKLHAPPHSHYELATSRPKILQLAGFSIVYLTAGWLSHWLMVVPTNGVTLWLPSGLFLAVLLLSPTRNWPWWVLAGLPAEAAASMGWFAFSLPGSLAIYLGNTLEALAGCWLIRHCCKTPFRLQGLREVMALAFMGVLLAPTFSATVGAAVTSAAERQPYAVAWSLWWLGDSLGILIFAPLVLSVVEVSEKWRGLRPIRWIEAAAMLVAVAGVTHLVFINRFPVTFLLLLPVLWGALRFEIIGAAFTTGILAVLSLYFTASGTGIFTGLPYTQQEWQALIQLFLFVVMFSALVVAALTRQRRELIRALTIDHDILESQVRERTVALRESEARLLLAQRSAEAGVWDINLVTGHTLWSEPYYELYGLPPKVEPSHDDWIACIHPDDRRRVEERFRQLEAGQGEHLIEFRILRGGEVRWLRSQGQIVRDGGGKAVRATGITFDITQRKQEEEQTRHNQLRLQLALDAAYLISFEWNIPRDEVRRYVSSDPSLPPTLEDTPSTFESVCQVVHPDDRERFIANVHTALERADGRYENEFRILHPDRKIAWLFENGRVEKDSLGRPQCLIGLSQDITRRKQSEEALRSSETRLRRIFEQSPAGIVQTDTHGNMVLVNERWCEMLGYSEAELLAMNVADITHASSLEATLAAVGHLVQGGPDFQIEKNYRRKDGTILRAQSNVAALRDAQGNYEGLLAVVLDVSERLEAEARLRESDERIHRRNEQLALMSRVSEDLIFNHRTEQEMLTATFGQVAEAIGAEMYFSYQPYDEVSMRLCNWAGLTDDERTLFETMRYGELLCGRVAVRRQPIIVEDIAHTDVEGSEAVRAAGYGAYAGFPLLAGNELYGTVAFITRTQTHFAEGEVEMIHTICAKVAAMLERSRLTKELAANEERQRLGAQVAGLALAEIDYSTGLNHLSAEAARLFGLGEEPLVLPRGDVHATFHAEDAPELMHLIAASLEPNGRGWFEMDHRVVWPDGQVRWLRVRKQVSFEGEGLERRPVRAMLAALDVTAKKQSAEVIRRNAAFVRNVMDSLPALVVVVNGNGTVIMANKPWNQYAEAGDGDSAAVSQGANYLEVCRRASLADSPEARTALNALEDVITGRTTESSLEYPCEMPDGVHWFIMHVKDLAEGGPGLVISHTDITERRNAERALRESEARYRTLHESLGDGVFIAQDHRFVFTNTALPAMLGYSNAELNNTSFEAVIAPEFLTLWTERFNQRVGEGLEPPWSYEVRLLPKTGNQLIWAELRAKRIQYLDKPAVLGILRNITEHKNAESILRDSEQRLRLALEASALGIWEWNVRTNQIHWDAQMFRIYGITPKPDGLVQYEDWSNAVLSEDLPQQEAILRETARNQCRSSRAFRINRPDGEVRYIEAMETVRPDAHGVTEWVVGTNIDVTERKLAEDRLRLAHDTFFHLVQNSPFGVYVVDADFRLIQVSQGAQKVFENVRPLIGRDFAEVLRSIWPETFASNAIDRFRHTLETGEPFHAPRMVEQRRDIGELESYDWKIERIMLPDGRFGVVCHFYDLSERQQYEAALKETDRRKDEFLATLAHELRNPLAPISNSLHILRMPGIDQETIEQVREMMARQVNHMVRLVDELMEVSRVSRGIIELRKERVDLAQILQSAVETSRPLIDKARHQLDIRLPDPPIALEADVVRLTQVIANLLNNAAKYTPEGGRIWLSAKREGSQAVVSVRDNGMGIPEEMLPKIFDLFTQVDRNTHRVQGGLGIGLTLVQHLVTLHEGSIEVESDGPNQGSEFRVRLFLVEEISQPGNPLQNEDRAGTISPHRILVVDDNTDVADSLALVLSQMMSEVKIAYGGPAALEIFKTYQPSVILLDIGMPDMDGYEVARQIRQLPEGKAINIIALTGWGQEEDRRKTKAAGFDHHLVKPVNLKALKELLVTLPTTDLTS